MKKNGRFLAAGICGLAAAVLVILIRTVDVRPIGPEGTCIGLSHLNEFIFRLSGVNMIWYEITDWLGIAAILTAFVFAVIGLIQMIRRRSMLKVDREILALGGLYIVVIALYVLFEMMIVNFRPVIMPGSTHPEASFPSSHTMIVCVIMGSAMMLTDRYIRGGTLRNALRICCAGIIGVTVVGRLISGVHWLTDIIGGILISMMLLGIYSGILESLKHNT